MSQWTEEIKEILTPSASIADKLREELRKKAKRMIEDILETLFEENRKDLAVKKQWQRNGMYKRSLVSVVGLITDISVPRARKAIFQHDVFVPFQRRQKDVDLLLTKLFIQGESYRDLQRVMRLMFNDSIGLSSLTRLTNRFYTQIRVLTMPTITATYDILWLDAIYFSVKKGHHTGCVKKLVLAALGHNTTNNRDEFLGYIIADSESEVSYSYLLRNLLKRGLRWHKLQVIVHDGEPAISAAIENIFGDQIPQQSCIFHKLNNVNKAIRHRDMKDVVLKDAAYIYDADSLDEYQRRLKVFVKRYRRKEPDATNCVLNDRFITTQYRLPVDIRIHLHTTNPIERKFREIRRRTNIIGCFENISSLEKIMFFIIQFINQTAGVPPVCPSLAITHN